MILAQYVIVQRILKQSIDEQTRQGIIRHFEVTRKKGVGWGFHPESEPYVFVTTLAYIALRFLGVAPDEPLTASARAWLWTQPGGVLSIPTWGKFWLSMLGLYEYSGMNPISPEMVLLPPWLPFHPDKLFCHTRYVFFGMAYLYGRNFRTETTAEITQLRRELYPVPYDEIDFTLHRHDLAQSDICVRPNAVLRMAFNLSYAAERLRKWIPCSGALRRLALARCAERMTHEQHNSEFQSASPVNGLLSTLALFDRKDTDLVSSLKGLESWRWEDSEEGVRFAGARSSTWDTAFAMQATLEYEPAAYQRCESLRRAYRSLKEAQILEDMNGRREQCRDPVVGGWCFGGRKHSWPVSDCTAEALSAILMAHDIPELIPASDRISSERLQLAVTFILSRQNPDGGFGAYERKRGGRLLEMCNPTELFGNCMGETSYVELTASAIKALECFRAVYPEWETAMVQRSISRAWRFLRSRQRTDGSYPSAWGINFTYAMCFVMEAVHKANVQTDDPLVKGMAEWLVKRQRADGGWGEHFNSCFDGVYQEHPQSQAVMTAWALLALLPVLGPRSDSVARGVRWLREHQTADGSWPSESVNVVFFKSAMHDYRLYLIYFPTWALARWRRMIED